MLRAGPAGTTPGAFHGGPGAARLRAGAACGAAGSAATMAGDGSRIRRCRDRRIRPRREDSPPLDVLTLLLPVGARAFPRVRLAGQGQVSQVPRPLPCEMGVVGSHALQVLRRARRRRARRPSGQWLKNSLSTVAGISLQREPGGICGAARERRPGGWGRRRPRSSTRRHPAARAAAAGEPRPPPNPRPPRSHRSCPQGPPRRHRP
jgi:hypothetical protein